MDNTTLSLIKKWYSGKSLAVIEALVIPTLIEASALGYWPKGTATKVRAALNKMNVAIKFGKKYRKFIDGLSTGSHRYSDDDSDDGVCGHEIEMGMFYGQIHSASKIAEIVTKFRATAPRLFSEERDTEGYRKDVISTPDAATLKLVLDTAAEWASDFAPVAALVEKLDATRPAPTVRFLGTLSKSVLDNLGSAMSIKLDSVRQPEIKWEWVEKLVKGKLVRIAVGTIIWPEGTRHNASKHADKHSNCHACGHAIYNPWNWVPLVGETEGAPVSLWVGRDCAKNILNVEVSGEGEYTERNGAK